MSMRTAEPTFATRKRLMNVVANGKRNSSEQFGCIGGAAAEHYHGHPLFVGMSASLRIRPEQGALLDFR